MSLALRFYRGVGRLGTGLHLPEILLRGRPEELRERNGHCPPGGDPAPLWIHAASLGELDGAGPLIRELRVGAVRIALSSMTRTGRIKAATLEPDVGPFHAPIDAPGPIARCLDRLRPRALVVLETELWPALLGELSGRGIAWGMASARLTERSARRMRRAAGLYGHVLRTAAAIGARTSGDAERFLGLGAPPDVVGVTGDLKEDREPPPRSEPPADLARWIAACTRPGEEGVALAAVVELSKVIPTGELTLAPRHPERFEEAARLVQQSGLPWRRWVDRADDPPGPGWSVVLVDEMGVLDEAYRRAGVAFVGGSLSDLGGHSPLQAAAAGRPVLFGPSDTNCRDAVRALEAAGALARVSDASGLARGVAHLLADPAEARRRGDAAHAVLRGRSGAARRTVDFLTERGVLR